MGFSFWQRLLRHTYREDGKVKQLTLGNISDLPDDLIGLIRKRLAGGPLPAESDDFQIVGSLPHGHVAAVLGTLEKIGLDRIISAKPCREAQLVTAMIVLRIIAPASKLANLASLRAETAEQDGLDWITALRSGSIKKLVQQGTIQLSLFDERDLAEVTCDDDPGEPLVVCRNPLLADERARNRKELLAALKSVDLKVRPIYHWKDDRIKSHVLLCMLAYYVEWHLRGALAELQFDDHEREADRKSIVSPAPRSAAAQRKDCQRRTPDGLAVQSFQCLLKDLATLCKNRVR